MDNIWENHIPKLREVLQKDPTNARALEFLIQSLESFLTHTWEPDEMEAAVLEISELYARRFELPFVFEEQKRYFMMRFIDTARLGKVLTPEELFGMADELCKADPTRPEPFLIRAVIASTIPNQLVTKIYQLAREAAAVAESVRLQGGLNNSSPYDMSTEWKAHRLAAIAASNLAKKHPEMTELVHQHIRAGMAMGGPWVAFKGIVDDGKVEAKVTLGEGEAKVSLGEQTQP